MMKFEVKNRFTDDVQFTAEIDATEQTPRSKKLGMAVKWALDNGVNPSYADLSNADLSRADMYGVDLSGANLSGADLSYADLSYADLSRADMYGVDLSCANFGDISWVPIIPNIHQTVYAAASKSDALDMSDWHSDGFCGTTHCRAGWVLHLAGEKGQKIEKQYGPAAGAWLIYRASDPDMTEMPDFYNHTNAEALADMKRLAEAEAAKQGDG